MKISYGKVILGSVFYAVIAQIVHTLGAFLTMGYYLMPEYLPVWSKIMMPAEGPPPGSLYVYSIVFALLTGLFLAYFYVVLRKSIWGDNAAKRGWCYGLIVFFIATIPCSLMLVLMINLPMAIIISWTVEMLVINVLAGMAIAKLMG